MNSLIFWPPHYGKRIRGEKMKIILYSKKGCHLCDVAKDLLTVFQKKFKYDFEEKDIYEEDFLVEEYGLMIPVVEINGDVVAYGKVTKDDLMPFFSR